MSQVNGKTVTAYNLKLKEKDRPMEITGLFRYAPKKAGGSSRYRLGGVDAKTGDGMSKFCNEKFAKDASKALGIKIVLTEAKPKKKKTCKKIGDDAKTRCVKRRTKVVDDEETESEEETPSPKKKAPRKKAPAKRGRGRGRGRAKK